MNRAQFEAAIAREGIRFSTYSLSEDMPPEKYVLRPGNECWEVYYSERGERVDIHRFDTESEAFDFLLLQLVRDPTTRVRSR